MKIEIMDGPRAKQTEIQAPHGITFTKPNGTYIHIHARSDGYISISTEGLLYVLPVAANTVYVEPRRY